MKLAFLGAALGAALLFGAPGLASAQTAQPVTSCGAITYTANAEPRPLTQTTDGQGCVKASLTGAIPAGTNLIGKAGIDQTTPGTTNGVVIAPTSASTAGIAPVVSTALEGSHVLKASAGNLYSAYVTTGATPGLLMIFNATTAPADGAVTPIHCLEAPANSTVGLSFSGAPPESYATGITAVFSTGTSCVTKAVSATAFFHGSVQ